MLTPINWRTACFLSMRSTLYWPPQNSKQNLWMTIKHPSIDLYLNNLPRHNPMNTKKCKYQAHNFLTSMQCKSNWSTDSPLALPIQLQLTRATTLLMMSKSNADIKWCQSFIVTPNTYDLMLYLSWNQHHYNKYTYKISLTYSSFYCHIQVCIIKNYAGCIATKFQRYLERSRSQLATRWFPDHSIF